MAPLLPAHRRPRGPSPAAALAVLVVALGAIAGCPAGGAGNQRAIGGGPAPAADGPVVFDASELSAPVKARFDGLAARLRSPCPDGDTLAAALEVGRACPRAHYAARAVARQLAEGEPEERVARQHERRYFEAPATFTLDGAPFEGMPDAPVVLVEFFDYDCYFCRLFAPVLDEILATYPSEVRLHFKHFPLSTHPDSEGAARAAVAAARQGRFREMHRALFANQGRHDEEQLLGLARGLGLDMARFAADLRDPAVRAQVERDRDEGDRAGLAGTPTLYINGRACEILSVADIDEWIRELLDPRLAPTPAPGAE